MSSVTSVTSICTSLASRATAAAAEVEEASWSHAGTSDPQWAAMKDVREDLVSLNDELGKLQRSIEQAAHVSAAARSEMLSQLQEFERALAAMDKQLRRLSSAGAELTLDGSVVEEISSCLKAHLGLLGMFQGLVEVQSIQAQERMLQTDSTRQVLAQTTRTRTDVLQRRDALRPRPAATGDADSPPQYSDGDRAAAAAASSSTSAPPQSSSSKGFLSGLSDTWNAVTSAMRFKPEPLVSSLCHATLQRDKTLMTGLLSQGANPNGKNEDGKTALFCAIDTRDPDLVEFVLDRGAYLAAKARGQPPLLYAALAGADLLPVVDLLLRRGADPNEKSLTGRLYFIDVVDAGDVAVIGRLLDGGADPRARDLTGRCVLTQALHRGRLDVLRLLLDRGADPDARDVSGRPALVDAILQRGGAGAGALPVARLLLEKGADARARDITGLSILSYVVDRRDLALARLLLEHGADASARDLVGQSVLGKVVRSGGDKAMARLLLEHGADTSGVDAKILENMGLLAKDARGSGAAESSGRPGAGGESGAGAAGADDAPPDYESVTGNGPGAAATRDMKAM